MDDLYYALPIGYVAILLGSAQVVVTLVGDARRGQYPLAAAVLDPDPSKIKAPYSDHDAISNDTDYGGVLVDPRNDGKTGIEFIATPRGGNCFVCQWSPLTGLSGLPTGGHLTAPRR